MTLTPDEDTLVLLDLTGSAPVPTSSIKDYSSSGYNLTLGGAQLFVTGPGTDVKFVRAFEDQSTTNTQTVSDTVFTASRGELTIEAWIYPDPGHNGMTLINLPRGDTGGETIATNFTGRFHLGSDNAWDIFWESGPTGGNVDANQTPGTTNIQSGQWNHVAIVRKFGATTTDMEFYCNGNLDETLTNVGNMPDSGSGTDRPYISIGSLDGGAIAEPFDGFIRSLRFSNIPRSGSEISSSANRTDFDHPNDGNTVGLWKMDEQPSFTNRGNLGIHFSVVTPTAFDHMSLTEDNDGAVFIDAGDIQASSIPSDGIATILTSSDWTIDFWYRPVDTADEQTFFTMTATGETSNTNTLFNVALDVNYKFTFFAERDAGTNLGDGIPSYTTTASLPSADRHNRNHFALRKVKSGPHIYLDFFHNGSLLETSSGSLVLLAENGGELGAMSIAETAGTTDTVVISQLRLTKRQLTDQEILSTFQTGATASAAQTITTIFRALSGSQYIFFRDDEPIPPGVSFITIAGTISN